jgi:hypothetical protein
MANDGASASDRSTNFNCEHQFFQDGTGFGTMAMMKRSDNLDETSNILKDGSLVIDVLIQVKGRSDDLYQPAKDISKNLHLLRSGGKSGVVFQAGGKGFPVHSPIMYANAPLLAEICDQEGDCSSVVAINDIHPDVFQHVIEHIYGGVVPPVECAVLQGKELIDAANRYELVEMKMAVENILFSECVMDIKNVSG